MKRYFLFFLIVAPLLYLLAFGLTRDARELPSMMVGKPSPDFVLQTLDGKTLTRESLKGRPFVINFWATWCGPCFFEHGVFKEVSERYAKEHTEERVEFLGVVYQDKKEAVEMFLKEYGTPFTVGLDPVSKMAIAFGVGGIPETFFVDAAGVIRSKFTGVLSVPQLEMQLEKLVKTSEEGPPEVGP